MKKLLLGTLLLSSLALAQDKTKAMDPCGSPKEFYSKYLLDKCYKGYFDAIVESKKLAEDAAKKADEANKKVSGLEGRVSELEKRLNALSERPAPAPAPTPAPRREEGVGPYRWQLEEVGRVYFDFDKFNIKPSEAKKLDEIVERLRSDSREVLVVGFADTRGTSKYNFNLSMWRAQMTASYLAKKGVDIGKIRVASYGKEVAELLGNKHREQRVVIIYLIK
ncbi:MAG: OmpA family protein [Aquificota bacterium]|nr:MAG: OmpA family protein [Aquificota bacterium]